MSRKQWAAVLVLDAWLIVIVFVVGLKLFGLIDWSWKWVSAPAWIPILSVVLAFAVKVFAVVLGELWVFPRQ